MPRRPRSRAPHRAILCRPRCAAPRAAAPRRASRSRSPSPRARPAHAADPPVEAPAAVAELLARVQDAAARSDPPAALAAVDGWTGPAHPLVDLARGHAYALADRLDPAITAYRAALAAEPTLRPAGLGLIAALARREHWPALTTELPRWHDPATADAPTLRLWLAAALGAEDAILAEEIARRALVRWPDEPRFRRGLAHALLVTDRPAAAAAVIRRLIAAEPADPALWQQLAQAAPDAATRRAALEAAVLAEPTDRPRRAHLVEALLAAGHAPAALAYARPLGATPLAIRAAVAADATEQATAWLATIPAADRDPPLRRLAARVALARGDRDTARAELAALLAADAADVPVLVQLAALERDAGALDRAEALLRQGAAAPGPEAGLAVAWLAHLLLRRGRRAEAAALLRRHLTAWPADTTARALLTVAEG
ncbi:MAG: hypothetical protein H6705_10380 [Myxococcales bacterium]|nr:hypothetical protein [Myxococcales bacterium]